LTKDPPSGKLSAYMIQEFEQLPTTHFLVTQGIVRSDKLSALPWRGRATFEGLPTDISINWHPGYTDIEISNRFVAEKWQIKEAQSNIVTLSLRGVGIKELLLGFENRQFEWTEMPLNHRAFLSCRTDLSCRTLYFKGNRPDWKRIPDHVAKFPLRTISRIDKATTEIYLFPTVSIDQAIGSFMQLKKIIESATPATS